mmetsp:Transcript_126570/g.253047  ORF Transcript_126570/g.253047 Transcript_126570/m.253047 type:complete len:824 (+) Transcript_126570:45-2516(+)
MAVFHVFPYGIAILILASLTSTYTLLHHLCKTGVTESESFNNAQEVSRSHDVPGLILLQTGITLSDNKPGIGVRASSSKGSVSSELSEAKNLALAGKPWGKPQGRQSSIRNADDLMGVKKNSPGDLTSILTGLGLNMVAMFAIGVMFWIMRMRYPRIYVNNALDGGTAPRSVSDLPLGWVWASLRTTTDEAVVCAGLDQALLIDFCDVAMRILVRIAVPTTLVLCPLHYFLGGNRAKELGDNLSRVAMGNVVRPHPWIMYVHAFFVWLVVLITLGTVNQSMQAFLVRRARWLKELPYPQASTILVEGIPENCRSDAKLREFFEQLFSSSDIRAAHIVKDTGELMKLHQNMLALEDKLQKAEVEWATKDHAEEFRPHARHHILAERTDAITLYQKQIAALEEHIKEKRALVIEAAQSHVGGVNTRNGFVTFAHRREAELAVNLQYSNICVEWQVSYAPEPEGVDWNDLRRNINPRINVLLMSIGYAIIMALYVLFLPVCIATTNLAYTCKLGPLQNLWMAIAPSLSLTIFMSFLPTVMIKTFDAFFILKSKTWCQLKLQDWYFWFQVFFVILVTAIGTNFFEFVKVVASKPTSLFILLARQMPEASHFYMDYLILQCTLQVWSLIRSAQIGKFLAARAVFEEEEARVLSEPEDQDYFGIGSRSARATIMLLIGIIFSTLSPLVSVLSMAFFFVSRIVYGYLIVFAETKKPDLGGAFFVLQLQHVQVGLGIFCILMTGVLTVMSPSVIPPAIAAPSLFYTLLSAKSFREEYLWEKLPFKEIILNVKGTSSKDTHQVYVQPELQDRAHIRRPRGSRLRQTSQEQPQ